MTKSDPKGDTQENATPKTYAKKKVSPGKSYVNSTSSKGYPTEKKSKSYGKKSKTPSTVERELNPREVDTDRKKSSD